MRGQGSTLLRTILRRLLYGLAGLVAFILVAFVVLLIALATPWGMEQLRDLVNSQMRAALVGGGSIGQIEGSVFGDLIVHDIVINDASGSEAIVIESARIHARFLPLLRKVVYLERLDLVGMHIQLREDSQGTLNVSRLVEPSDQRFSLRIGIDAFTVADSSVSLSALGRKSESLESLYIAPSRLAFSAAGLELELGATSARHRERGVEVGMRGGLSLRKGRVSLRELSASVAGARLEIQSALVENQQLRDLHGEIRVPARSIRALVPGSPWLADTLLHFQSEGSAIQLRGTVADAELRGYLRPALVERRAELALDLKAVDLLSFWPGLPSSALEVSLTAALGPEASHARLTSRGTVLGKHLDAASVSLHLRGEQLAAGVAVHGAGASQQANAKMELAEQLTITKGRVEFASDELSTLVAPWLDLRGDAHAQFTLKGSIDSLAVAGWVHSAGLEAFGVQARDLMLRPNIERRGDGAMGRLVVSASSLRSDGVLFTGLAAHVESEDGRQAKLGITATGPNGAVELDATLSLESTRLGIQLERGTAQYGELRIRRVSASGSWIFAGPRAGLFKIDTLALQSNLGTLALEGEWRSRPQPGGRIDIDARRIDLHLLARALALKTPLAGTVSIKATVDTLGGRRADIDVHADRVAAAQLPGLGGDLSIRLRQRDLRTRLKASMPGTAELALSARLRIPRRPLPWTQWLNLDSSALRSLEAHANLIDASTFSHLHPGLPRTGHLFVSARKPEGETKTLVELRGSGLLGSGSLGKGLDVPAHARVHLELDGKRIVSEGEVGFGERATAMFLGTVQLLGPWFATRSYSGLDVDSIQALKVSTSEIELDWLFAQVAPELDAHGALARASLVCPSMKKSCELAARVKLPRGGAMRRKLAGEVTLRARLDEHHTRADIAVSVNTAKKLKGRGELAMGWRDLLEGRREFRRVGGQAKLQMRQLPLRALREIVPGLHPALDMGLRGRLSAELSYTGTLEAPLLRAQVAIDKALIHGVAIASVTAEGDYADGKLSASASARQAGGGSLEIRAQSDLKSSESPQVLMQIDARRFDLAFVGAFLPGSDLGGVLSAQLRVRGSPTRPVFLGTVSLSGGSFHPGSPFYSIKNAEIQARLTAETMSLEATVESGGGKARVRGVVDLSDQLPSGLKLMVTTDHLPVDAANLLVRVDSAIRLSGRYLDSTWSLSAEVERATVNLPSALSRSLHPVAVPPDLIWTDQTSKKGKEPGTPLVPRAIELALRTKKAILVKGDGVNALVGAALQLHLDDELRVRGSVRVDQGRIEIMGRRYQLKTGEATFSGDPDPSLNVVLAHEFDAMTLFVDLSGTASKPVVGFRSEPAQYDQAELLAFVLGASPDDMEAGSRSRSQAAKGVATNLLAGQLSRIVTEVVPIDLLQLETEDASPERVALGKWLTEKLLVAYRHRFTVDPNLNTDELIFEYRFLERWLLEGYIGQVEIGADLLWIRRY